MFPADVGHLNSRNTENQHEASALRDEELKRLGCTVLHDVDVNDMHEQVILRKMKFDCIVFNFPHARHDAMYCERHMELIRCIQMHNCVA